MENANGQFWKTPQIKGVAKWVGVKFLNIHRLPNSEEEKTILAAFIPETQLHESCVAAPHHYSELYLL